MKLSNFLFSHRWYSLLAHNNFYWFIFCNFFFIFSLYFPPSLSISTYYCLLYFSTNFPSLFFHSIFSFSFLFYFFFISNYYIISPLYTSISQSFLPTFSFYFLFLSPLSFSHYLFEKFGKLGSWNSNIRKKVLNFISLGFQTKTMLVLALSRLPLTWPANLSISCKPHGIQA